MFKRFTLLVVGYIREKFVWAKKKLIPISVEAEHDKRVAENYVFDEVQGIYVPRAEHEERVRFNSDNYGSTQDEIRRFPSSPKQVQSKRGHSMGLTSSIPQEQARKNSYPSLKPPGFRGIDS